MIVNASIGLHAGTVPPTANLSIVRRDDRRVTLVVRGLGALTLTKLVWTGKVSASDLDSAKTFQKVMTTSSTLATVGRITDTGTNGVARATCSFTPSDSASWPDTQTHQLWAVLSDGNPYLCLTGTIRSRAPIPTSLVTDTVVASVTVAPASGSIVELATQQFTATARNAAGQTIVGASITWSVPSGGSFASVDASGLATGLAIGTATIRATSGSVFGEATLGVTLDPTPASVVVSPASASIQAAGTQQFTAAVKNANTTVIPGATVAWSSLATGIATVNSSSGLATGVSAGSATIRATSSTVHGDASLTVSAGVTDSFNRADNPTSLGTADSGQVWTAHVGTWAITGGQARLAASAGENVASLDVGKSNQDNSVDFASFVDRMRIVARLSGGSDYLFAQCVGGSGASLFKLVGGGFTQLGSTYSYTPANGDRPRLVTNGSAISLYIGATLAATATDAFNSTATRAGIGQSNVTPSTQAWDNFSSV